MSIRVLLADDHQMMREGLRMFLEQTGDITVVAEARNGREATRKALEIRPDVVVMDIGMTDMNGIEASRRICDQLPNTRVVILSMHGDRQYVMKALDAGASGYVLKDKATDELVKAIYAVAQRRRFLSEEVTQILTDVSLGPGRESVHTPLGKREREVLQHVAEGKTSGEIASLLGISIRTVETHRHRIMQKLGLHSIAELTKYAVREGMTELKK